MSQNVFHDGKILFKIPELNQPSETYYKVYGDLLSSGPPPLVVLHGGPGSGHEYVEPFSKIWTRYGIPVVFYDQIGCGKSTHFRDKKGDKLFWQPSLFIAELQNVLDNLNISQNGRGFHLLGHSWGAMLAVLFVAENQPPGLQRLILGGGPADAKRFKKNLLKLIDRLPLLHQDAINKAIQYDDFTDPAYLEAMKNFDKIYTCRADPWPPEMLQHLKHQAEDPTVRESLLGRSPVLFNGTLEHYNCISLLSKINIPTLIFSGEFDTARDSCMEEFFNRITKVRWVKFAGASHIPYLDSEEMLDNVLKLVGRFLQQTGD